MVKNVGWNEMYLGKWYEEVMGFVNFFLWWQTN
jgi:hypothetical protein